MTAMPLPLALPFFVAPYPDEMLGSWLFRLQVHNHSSLIQHIVSSVTPRKIDKSGWRDMVISSPEFQQLLDALGTTYGTAMMEFTTYPYWLRFHSAERFDLASQNKPNEIPALILRDRRQTIPRLRHILPNLVRICPACLAEDFAQYGEPYLHRAHHLPFVRICHKHRTALISRCPKCSQLFRMESTFVFARLTCTCKYDLRQSRPDRALRQEAWERLAHYSADVLFSKETIEECGNFYRFFDSQLVKHSVTKRPELLEHLEKAYGADEAKAILTLAPQRSDTYTHSPIGSVSKQEFRAPQICAFLATIDFSFLQSNSRLASFVETHSMEKRNELHAVHPDSSRRRLPRSIAEARLYVADAEHSFGKNVTRTLLYRRYKTLFWYMTLFDQEWFEENYPPGGRGATDHLPSIESDRLSISQAICNAPKNSVRVWKNLAQQAFFRASLRDVKWLEERKSETAHEIREDKLARKRQHLENCANDIEQAIKQIQTIKRRPIRISPSKIAPYTALNEYQLRHFFSKNPDIRDKLIIVAADWPQEKT